MSLFFVVFCVLHPQGFEEAVVLAQTASQARAFAVDTVLGNALVSAPENLWSSYSEYLPKSAVAVPLVFSDISDLGVPHRQPSLPFISGAHRAWPLPCKLQGENKFVDTNRVPLLTSGDTFRLYCNHVFDEVVTRTDWAANVSAGDIVFVKTDFLDVFFTTVHPEIAHKYILLTHNSDYSIPHDPRMPGPKSETSGG